MMLFCLCVYVVLSENAFIHTREIFSLFAFLRISLGGITLPTFGNTNG